MKNIATLLAYALLASANASTQQGIPIYLNPSLDAPQIGELETRSLAISAEWPDKVQPVENWRPIYYRGVWEVYLHNNDLAKELTAKP